MKKWTFPTIVILLLAGLVYWGYRELTKPLPGEAVPVLSRDHVNDISQVKYNSNPPTSGPHFSQWAKPGKYDVLVSDGYLIHSLEHGYIILSYDCERQVSSLQSPVSSVYAHGDEKDEATVSASSSAQTLNVMMASAPITPETAPKDVPAQPDAFKSDPCKKLGDRLAEYLKVAHRVIVVPRPGMDTPIALTAWTRIEKLNGIDDGKIREFVRAWENKGPERTME